VVGFAIAVIVVLTAILSGFGHRWQWWHFGTGFQLLSWSIYGAGIAAMLSLLGAFLTRPSRSPRRKGFTIALIGLVLSLGLLGLVGNTIRQARAVPPIHDISTDTDDPPVFQALFDIRQATPNGADYAGAELAGQQQHAYPDIEALLQSEAPRRVFDEALAAAENMGWEIARADPDSGHIEATDTTFWYGFKDDIVIRITPEGDGSRLDIRSMSRVGKSDIGTNAARIRAFFQQLAD
jgi:uncharacterized protein (DUF1499 family)